MVTNLNKNGLKNTRHRSAILEILKAQKRPMSTDEIFLEMKKMDIEINMSTVYRALKSLAEKNIVTKITFSNGQKSLYEISDKRHCHYLVCLGCKKVVPLEHCPVKEGYENAIENETGFTIEGHNLEVFGYCPDCTESKK